jgi:hypothetical protein
VAILGEIHMNGTRMGTVLIQKKEVLVPISKDTSKKM